MWGLPVPGDRCSGANGLQWPLTSVTPTQAGARCAAFLSQLFPYFLSGLHDLRRVYKCLETFIKYYLCNTKRLTYLTGLVPAVKISKLRLPATIAPACLPPTRVSAWSEAFLSQPFPYFCRGFYTTCWDNIWRWKPILYQYLYNIPMRKKSKSVQHTTPTDSSRVFSSSSVTGDTGASQ